MSTTSSSPLPGDLDPVRTWLGTLGALVAVVVGGSIAFPDEFYGGFVWHYFWGPVYADAQSATCAVWDGGAQRLLYSDTVCQGTSGIVAEPGYTVVSEIGYILILVFMLAGVVLLVQRLRIGTNRSFFYALVPFSLFGGGLRVIEDASDSVPTGVEPIVTYPLNTLLISPIIYFTVFFITLATVVGCVRLSQRDLVDSYERPLFIAGWILFGVTLAILGWLSLTRSFVDFYPLILLVVFGLATGSAVLTWALAVRYMPELRSGTGPIGFIVIWGHAVDGAANVIGLDWASELGLGADLVPKHPVNRFVINVTNNVLPADIIAVTGDTWPFLVLKLLVATGAVWLFNEDMLEDSPRSTLLLLVAVLAVGLGPGTRDVLRASFGV